MTVYSPSYELYLALGTMCQEQGFRVFKALPSDDTEYPFVVLNYYQELEGMIKDSIGSTVSIDLDFWGTIRQQPELVAMTEAIRKYNEVQTDHYIFRLRKNQTNYQLREDNSVPNTKLYHGILTLSFYLIARKEK